MHSNNFGNAWRSVSMLLPPQLLYAGERAPTAYWVRRGQAPESVCTLEKREKLCLCWELEKKNSLLCIIVLKVLLFRIGHRKRKCHWVEFIQENYMDIFEHRFLEKISNFEMKKNILSKWRHEKSDISLYSDLQLTISNTATNATTVTTTAIITVLFTTANTFKGELNSYSNSDFYQDIRNILSHRFFRRLFWVQKNSGVVKFRYQSVHKSFYTWINTLWNQVT